MHRSSLAAWETGSDRPSELAERYLQLWIAAALGEPLDLPGLLDDREGETL